MPKQWNPWFLHTFKTTIVAHLQIPAPNPIFGNVNPSKIPIFLGDVRFQRNPLSYGQKRQERPADPPKEAPKEEPPAQPAAPESTAEPSSRRSSAKSERALAMEARATWQGSSPMFVVSKAHYGSLLLWDHPKFSV